MKIVEMKREQNLYQYARNHLPDSLQAFEQTNEYGDIYGITIHTHFPKRHIFDFFRNEVVAQLDYDTITLFKPQYCSDMENLAASYEKLTGRTVTLRIWEKRSNPIPVNKNTRAISFKDE